MAYPIATTEMIRFGIPPTAKQWAADRMDPDKVWHCCFWKDTEGSGGKKKYFDIDDGRLTLEGFQKLWGAGVFRIHWCGNRGRHKHTSDVFEVLPADGTPAALRIAARPGPAPGTPAPVPAAALTNGGSNGGQGATAQHAPPLLADTYERFIGRRDTSPLELLLAVDKMCDTKMQMHLAHEERRSSEHRKEMELRALQINRDADVRIAEAQARALSDRERASTVSGEVTELREQLLEQIQTTAAAGDTTPAMREVLEEVCDRLDAIGAEEEEQPGLGAQVLATLINEFLPMVRDAAAKKISGDTPALDSSGAGTMAGTVDAAAGLAKS